MESESLKLLDETESLDRVTHTSRFLLLPLRRFHPRRYRPGNLGTWSGHLPFANDLIATLRPSVLVELGTHYGESYFGFCQAVEENRVDCQCWAVDTWQGDEHAGFYDESVFEEVTAYNGAHYRLFSQLLRTTFEAASEQFAEGSIDLLHIDGLHTLEAVRRDFEQWLPKVRPGGLILIHDINVRHADFEVWRLWDDLKHRFRTFEFRHWWGLGVLQNEGADRSAGRLAEILLSSSEEEARAVRDQYGMAAEALEMQERSAQPSASPQPGPLVQVFGGLADGSFSETQSAWKPVEAGSWQHHVLPLPQGSKAGALRLDVINCPALIDLAGLTVKQAVDGRVLVQLSKEEEMAALPGNSELVALPPGSGPNFFSYGFDPHLLVRAPEGVNIDVPLTVEVWMRVRLDLSGIAPLFQRIPGNDENRIRPDASLQTAQTQRDLAIAERALAIARIEEMRAELQAHHTERVVLHAEYRRLATARDTMAAENQQLRRSLELEQNLRVHIEMEAAEARLDVKRLAWGNEQHYRELEMERSERESRSEALEDDLRLARKQVVELQAARELAQTLLREEEKRRRELLHSYSWRITGPLRTILGLFLPGSKGTP